MIEIELIFLHARGRGSTCEFRVLEINKKLHFQTSDETCEVWETLDNFQIRQLRVRDRKIWNWFANSERYSKEFDVPASLPQPSKLGEKIK